MANYRKPSVETTLPLDCLRLDGGTQMRQMIRQDKIEEYAERMQAGDNFPRIDVFDDNENYWVADGFHRVGSAAKLGYKFIDCMLHDGDLRDAILFAIRSNARHGIELTPDDKKQKILRLLSDQEWQLLPIKTLAEIARVSVSYFHRVKQELREQNELVETKLEGQFRPTGGAVKAIRKMVKQEVSLPSSIQLTDLPAVTNKTIDQLGQEITPEAAKAFLSLPDFQELRRQLKFSRDLALTLMKEPGGKLIEQQFVGYLDRCIEKLYEAEPYSACEACNSNPLCRRCNGDGWVSRLSFEGKKKK